MAPRGTVSISSQDPFTTGLTGVTYLGSEWVLNPIVRNDIAVPELLESVGGAAYPERLRTLVRILDIDPSWHMHAVSDGERRRVQLAMGLLRPWRVLLLDEVTVDLDLLSRKGFLDFLKRETEERGATVVYATHILDHLAGWPTHLVHVCLGRVKQWGEMSRFESSVEGMRSKSSGGSWMGDLVLEWLEEDLQERGPRKGQKEMWG